MAKRVKIPGRLESAETGNIVTGADAVMDDEKGKTQVVINSEVDAAIINLAQGKQDNLTFDSAPTEDSPNPVTSAGVYTADKVLSDAIEAILLLIPSAASALNKLVDMQTMNSSIATATASFKGTYNLVSDLHLGVDATHEQIGAALDALSLDADNNDYAFVQVPNSATAPTEISKTERFKFNGTNWLYEYDLNNSGFTSPQWNAINSGVTSLLVGKLSDLPTNAELTTLLAGKQDNLTFDNAPTAGSPNPVTSGGVYARNNEIVALINALDAAKQDVLTFDSTPINGSTNPVTSNGVYLAISLVQAAVVALDGRMSTAEARIGTTEANIVNLQAAYAALTQSDIVVVEGVLPSTGQQQNVIYRQPDPDHTPPQFYSDYMWNGTAWVLMATYNNAIDDVPTAGSENLVKSGGVYLKTPSQEFYPDLFGVSDEHGNIILLIKDGYVETKEFDSKKLSKYPVFEPYDLCFADEDGNIVLLINKGDIRTKNFDSSKLKNVWNYTLKVPSSSIPLYIVCNDLDRTKRCAIGTRNRALSAYIDHFYYTTEETNIFFDGLHQYKSFFPKITGEGTDLMWNNGVDKYEHDETIQVSNRQNESIVFKVRSVLNSSSKNIFPKVLCIGDSITNGSFANTPYIEGAPNQYFSWAKYFFDKDADEYGSLFNSIFLGHRSRNEFSYDGVSGKAFACGYGGWSARTYLTSISSPFYTENGFSLLSYLNKYKTLEDDGVTRLVVGSTAGSLVTDVNAWDVCTPNVVFIQLGTNDTLSDWKTDIPSMVNSIKTEYPDMKIIISIVDGCTNLYPSLYPDYDKNVFFDNHNNVHTKLMDMYCYALDNWQDEANNIYVIYSGMTMPMPLSTPTLVSKNILSSDEDRYIGIESSQERVLHPNRYGHQEIGYLLYSMLKWIFV